MSETTELHYLIEPTQDEAGVMWYGVYQRAGPTAYDLLEISFAPQTGISSREAIFASHEEAYTYLMKLIDASKRTGLDRGRFIGSKFFDSDGKATVPAYD